MKTNYFFPVLLVLFFFGCTDDKEIEPRMPLVDRYYPLDVGLERTYEIDSVTYDFDANLGAIVIDTSQYFLKEIVRDKSVINGIEWFVVEELIAQARDAEYVFNQLVLERKENGRLHKKVGNLTFIPLASPLELFDEWDGTALFDKTSVEVFIKGEIIKPYENWNYVFIEEEGVLELEGKAYDDVIRINQADTASLESVDENGNTVYFPPEKQLFYELANEWYSPDKGLIMKEEVKLTSICASSSVTEFQDFCDTTTVFENAERGYIYRQKLISIE